ncbi:HAD family hydrolase [Ornithinibacillus gellani]|uniref:HAD family hydrolase n=1 Tax=Ornithinibacillus gellani TaxID=2293253 RepID=UPI000F4A3F4B|nr:HAD family hydrolase [Ornithinibacillus gellani]TQS75122.1 HAD family hydrolase [Ornithinibacillus gellani]
MKAIIFDFDGTLADTLPICFYSFQAVFKAFDNKELTTDEIKAMFGPSETGIIRENLVDPNHEQAIELYYEKYREKHRELVLDNEEMNHLLQQLKHEGYKLGIVTGKARRSLLLSLECLQMNDLFDVIITGDDVDIPKPYPEGVNKALDQLKIKNSEAMFLGDSEADILAGKQANVQTIGVQWLPNYQTPAFEIQPDQMFHSVEAFKQYLQTVDRKN